MRTAPSYHTPVLVSIASLERGAVALARINTERAF